MVKLKNIFCRYFVIEPYLEDWGYMKKEYFDQIRLSRGMTLEKLSELTEIPVGTLSKISSGSSKPSYHNMCLIANALNCSLDDFTDVVDSSLTKDELYVLNEYRCLNNHGKEFIKQLLYLESELSNIMNDSKKKIVECFIPTGISGDGGFWESCNVSLIEIADNKQYNNFDFCIKMVSDAFCPVFFQNDYLAVSSRFPKNGDTAIFLHDNRQYLRKYYRGDNSIKLVPLIENAREFELPDLREFVCIGTVLTVLHDEVNVVSENMYRKNIYDKKSYEK